VGSLPDSFHPASLVGTILDGRYRVVAHIASGGMGAIFRAQHVYMRKELALKVLRPELSTLPDIAERFRREAEIAASLEHDNIVRVTDFGRTAEGWFFLAMELLEGESLFDRLLRGPATPEETLRILVQVCRGLDAAHARGVVHRDLKPENIFLAARPPGLVKLLDFGIAKLTDPQTVSDTQAGVVVGTPEYLSPEQALGGAVDGRADVYAVGLIGWRMLAGQHPFSATDARGLLMMQATRPVPPLTEVRPDLASCAGLLATISRACAKEVGERHASASELCANLEACLGSLERSPPLPIAGSRAGAGTPTSSSRPRGTPLARDTVALSLEPISGQPAAPPSALARARAFARAHRLLFSLAASAVLLAAGGVALARWLEGRPAARARELLEAGRPEAARDLIAPAVVLHPGDARLRVLQGRAYHRVQDQAAGVKAYAVALELDPGALDAVALSDLAADLSRDREVADRAAQLLVRAGKAAIPTVLAAVGTGTGVARLRALGAARELGAEDLVDRVQAYGALLGDEDCEVRRAAARRLGEIGGPAALSRLSQVARETRTLQPLFGQPQRVPTCGAEEASAAIRRIQGR
jgi:eukaryotic-like serine/threonine-protein kinase